MSVILLMIGLYFAGCIALIVMALRGTPTIENDLDCIIEEIETAPLHDGGLLMIETQIDLTPCSTSRPQRLHKPASTAFSIKFSFNFTPPTSCMV